MTIINIMIAEPAHVIFRWNTFGRLSLPLDMYINFLALVLLSTDYARFLMAFGCAL